MLLLSMAMLLPPTVCCAAVGTAGVAGVVVDGEVAGVVVDGGVAGCDVGGLLGPALGVGCEEGVEFPPPPPAGSQSYCTNQCKYFFHVVSSFFKLNLKVSVFGNKS